MYAFYYNTSEITYEIEDIDPAVPITLRAECIYNPDAVGDTKTTLKFYVNDVLVKTWAGIHCPSDTSYLFGLQIKSISDSSPDY